jgi:hypothetical protein
MRIVAYSAGDRLRIDYWTFGSSALNRLCDGDLSNVTTLAAWVGGHDTSRSGKG